ncbi:MAG: T9SS type A sorting domain-containing protein [Bacteroidota bacterium]
MNKIKLFVLILALIPPIDILHAQWIQTNGPYAGFVYCLTVNDSNLYAGTNIGVFLSTNNGTSWSVINSGLENTSVRALAIIPTGDGSDMNLFAGTSGGVFLSTNDGTSWTPVNSGLTNNVIRSLAVSPASGGNGTNLFAGATGGPTGSVFLSTNNGTSWTPHGPSGPYVCAFALSDTNLFAGTTMDGVILLSTNNSISWALVNGGLPYKDVYSLAVSDTNLFAGTSGGVFRSINKGAAWTAAYTGLTNMYVYSLTHDLSGNLFAGTGGGVFLSTDNGARWTEVNSGLLKTTVRSFAISGNYLFAGLDDGNVWRRPLDQMITSVRQITDETSDEFTLEDNYPNPFNPNTTIQFSLPKATYVTLNIYDNLGQEVAKLVSQQMNAGTYTREWNASGFASCVYYYRLEAGTFVETKKLLLLR